MGIKRHWITQTRISLLNSTWVILFIAVLCQLFVENNISLFAEWDTQQLIIHCGLICERCSSEIVSIQLLFCECVCCIPPSAFYGYFGVWRFRQYYMNCRNFFHTIVIRDMHSHWYPLLYSHSAISIWFFSDFCCVKFGRFLQCSNKIKKMQQWEKEIVWIERKCAVWKWSGTKLVAEKRN